MLFLTAACESTGISKLKVWVNIYKISNYIKLLCLYTKNGLILIGAFTWFNLVCFPTQLNGQHSEHSLAACFSFRSATHRIFQTSSNTAAELQCHILGGYHLFWQLPLMDIWFFPLFSFYIQCCKVFPSHTSLLGSFWWISSSIIVRSKDMYIFYFSKWCQIPPKEVEPIFTPSQEAWCEFLLPHTLGRQLLHFDIC